MPVQNPFSKKAFYIQLNIRVSPYEQHSVAVPSINATFVIFIIVKRYKMFTFGVAFFLLFFCNVIFRGIKLLFMGNKNFLGSKLKELRKAHNYTQDYVASVLGVVRQSYSHYETGKRMPSPEVLYKLAGLYDISIDELMHLTIDIDRQEYFEAPVPTPETDEINEFLSFCNEHPNKTRYQFFTIEEKRLMFYFEKLNASDRDEIIEIARLKANKYR